MVPTRLRNLDLWVTVATAVTIGLLGAFNVVAPAVVGGATLATLGLLAISSLSGRAQLQTLAIELAERSLGDASADRLLTASDSGSSLDLDGACDIRIVGVTLARTIRTHHSALLHRLAAGATVRIALIQAGGDVAEEAARRCTIAGRADIFEHRLRPTMDLLRELAAATGRGPGRLDVRTLDFVPSVGLFAVDADEPYGRLLVDIYTHREGAPEPTLPLRAAYDHQWFRHFVREFDRIWEAGCPLTLAQPPRRADQDLGHARGT